MYSKCTLGLNCINHGRPAVNNDGYAIEKYTPSEGWVNALVEDNGLPKKFINRCIANEFLEELLKGTPSSIEYRVYEILS